MTERPLNPKPPYSSPKTSRRIAGSTALQRVLAAVTSVALAAAFLLMVTVPVDSARADNFFGGRIVEDKTLHLGVGFAQLEIAAKFQVLVPGLDVGARFTLEFARETNIQCCHIQVAADVRYRVLDDGPLQGSLLFSLPLGGTTKGGHFSLGILWPGFAGSYALSDSLDLDFGLQIQLTLLFEENTIAQAWIDAFVGMSYYATEAITIGFRFDVGPDIYGADFIARNNRLYDGVYVGLHFRGMLAAGFDL